MDTNAAKFTYWLFYSPESEQRDQQKQLTRAQFAGLLKLAKPSSRFPMWSRTYEVEAVGCFIQVTKVSNHEESIRESGDFAEWSDEDPRVEWRDIDDVESDWTVRIRAEMKARGLP
jgi:hypothetical protein